MVGGALAGTGKPAWRNHWQYWAAAVFASGAPDLDVIGFHFGIRYGDVWGHRGMTHSLVFAAGIAAILATSIPAFRGNRLKAALLLFAIAASHGVLDACTNGGLGVAFFSPFDLTRYFFSWRPIRVSPIGARFFSHRGELVLWSELIWVWIPTTFVVGLLNLVQHFRTDPSVETATAAD
jgi:inner membrane protein